MALSTELEGYSIDELRQRLGDRRYKTYEKAAEDPAEPASMLYAHKGLAGRIGPIVVHASMLLILAGAILGAMTGFFAQEMVPGGQTFKIQNVFEGGAVVGFAGAQRLVGKVNRFWIGLLA